MTDFAPTARIVADSVNGTTGDRVISVEVLIPRTLMPNLLTDVTICRTFTDVLETPVAENMRQLAEHPVTPIYWPAATMLTSHPAPPLRSDRAFAARETWQRARDEMVACAETLTSIGAHHTVANRLLEPFLAQRVLLTSTEWKVFFQQRQKQQLFQDPLVSAELIETIELMRQLIEKNDPEELALGEWHLPYIRPFELKTLPLRQAVEVSVARCHTGIDPEEEVYNIEADLDHFRQLTFAARPMLSPLEHVATPAARKEHTVGNLRGWHQYRYHRGDR